MTRDLGSRIFEISVRMPDALTICWGDYFLNGDETDVAENNHPIRRCAAWGYG